MDPAKIRELLDGVEDVITPAAKLDSELYANARCPTCGHTGADKVILAPKIELQDDGTPRVVRSAFTAASPIPKGHAQCQGCGVEYNPISGLIYKATHPILTDVQQ
jgi:hypothetical protein